ncbi:hypothetical protein [Vibrio jasicida]|uniref:hypothetical protein n=1 Tax=Vibrio jasicida TaxID=766224 RepID=UPI000CE3E89E|nr:hypothetical protein [Vibrio jasicida]
MTTKIIILSVAIVFAVAIHAITDEDNYVDNPCPRAKQSLEYSRNTKVDHSELIRSIDTQTDSISSQRINVK